MKSWLEISKDHLAANYRATLHIVQRETQAATALLAVIKANGYGHGATFCAPILARAGAEWMGITDVAEGIAVRAALEHSATEHPHILIMCGHLPEDAAAIVQHHLTPTVWHLHQLENLAQAAGTQPLPIHLEVDTGMSRQGVSLADLPALLDQIASHPQLRLDGVMTHFASAEVAGSEQTASQRNHFEAALNHVIQAGLQPTWLHIGNTSAIDNGADGAILPWLAALADQIGARPMVREGLGLYGYALPLEGIVAADGNASRLHRQIQPVMTWKTRILSLSEVPAGARIGYSGTFVAPHAMRLALLPIGYADGLRRELSSTPTSHGWVMIACQQAPIVGRISMNLTTVDVTHIPGLAAGDEVIVLGEGITADDHAAVAGTIAYEILCGMRAPTVLI